MDTVAYWLIAVGYFILGMIAGLILIGLLYPPLRTFPMTVLFVWGGALKRLAVLHLVWAMVFPIILLYVVYLLLNLFVPAYDIIRSRSFLGGLLGTVLITLFNGGFRGANLSADYADFMARHSTIPEDVAPLHILIATAVIQYCMSNYDDPNRDAHWDKVIELINSLEFNVSDEESLLKALKHTRAKDNEIGLAMELYSNRREYVEWQRQRASEQLEDELKEREFEELQEPQNREVGRIMKEFDEESS